MEDDSHPDSKDTVPLLGRHVSPSLRDKRSADRPQANAHMNKKSKPLILGIERVMTTSVYSDKMQVCLSRCLMFLSFSRTCQKFI